MLSRGVVELVVAVVVEERRDELVTRRSLLPAKKRARGRVDVARRCAALQLEPPFHEQNAGPDEVEAPVVVVVREGEQRRDVEVAAVRALPLKKSGASQLSSRRARARWTNGPTMVAWFSLVAQVPEEGKKDVGVVVRLRRL